MRLHGRTPATNAAGSPADSVILPVAIMPKDRRTKRDLHALNEDGMVVCNPRDKEAAHRAEMEGIATEDRAAVTCRNCLALLYERDKSRLLSRALFRFRHRSK